MVWACSKTEENSTLKVALDFEVLRKREDVRRAHGEEKLSTT